MWAAIVVGIAASVAIVLILNQPGSRPAFAHRDDLSPEEKARIADTLAAPTDFSQAQPFEINSGGATTSTASLNANAFSHPSKNLTLEGREQFFVGNGLFRKLWVSPPSSTIASDGLGPLFNSRGCQQCHLKDGRGHPPADANDSVESLLVRISIPPDTEEEKRQLADAIRKTIPDPMYGGQIQDNAVAGLPAEAKVSITWKETEVELKGEAPARLRQPILSLDNPGYGPFAPGLMTSIRVAPQMIGLGMLDAIHPGDIYALEDPDDADKDGISGRAHRVRDPETGKMELGRFGWKAAMPTIKAQNADAFLNDMGISSPLARASFGECTVKQTACRAMPDGVQPQMGDTEAPDPILELVAFYSANLAVPARRNVDAPDVLRGKALFHETGCASCHHPNFVTRKDAELAEHRFQLIWPYTDLLLHDMGEGLADNRPDGQANGREWRTPPLWGIGLTQVVSGHTHFLHDGRARNLLEAILWHGGEAQKARDRVADMTPAQRADIIAFLESL
ncbi:MAG: c-type cytochrome [Burkholderiales bacterium]|nr:MAG: c-type cytochrome [Burkholderiales bacterium]